MRRLMTMLAIAGGLALPGSATVFTWSADLDSSQEIPPNPSTATGSGLVRFDDITNILDLHLDWQGLTGDGIQAHIHCCVAPPPGNVGIALDLWLASDPRPATGSYDATYDLNLVNPFRAAFTAANGGTTLSAFSALRAAMDADQGRSYYNIHTALSPGGEIRGNLAPIPEPASVFTLLSGAAALLLLRRFRHS
ncbi:MAG: CHRD domain-containing protein [Bryobacteraceae bacterium]